MAILENETKNCFKIHFEECMIKGLSIYVVCSIYASKNERDKEKTRTPLVVNFLNNIQQKVATVYEDLLKIANATGKEYSELMDSNGIVKAEYEELRAKQLELHSIEHYPHTLTELFYRISGNEPADTSHIDFDRLVEFGFQKEWIQDPILITNRFEVYCGEYNGEPITHEFYYNKLKTTMSENIENI